MTGEAARAERFSFRIDKGRAFERLLACSKLALEGAGPSPRPPAPARRGRPPRPRAGPAPPPPRPAPPRSHRRPRQVRRCAAAVESALRARGETSAFRLRVWPSGEDEERAAEVAWRLQLRQGPTATLARLQPPASP
eukprot:tig00000808_g4408.t1